MMRTMGCVLAFALAVCGAVAADQHEETASGDMMQDPMMQAWMESMAPGEQHEMLAGMVGTWNADVKMWMGPEAEPMETGGTIEAEMLFDGRVLRESHSGTMMGMPFTGMSLTGYDNVTGVFWNVWMDNLGTGYYPSEGSFDAETGKLTLEGDWTGPMGEPMQVKMVGWHDGPDTRHFEMWTTQGETTYKSMESVYTRVE